MIEHGKRREDRRVVRSWHEWIVAEPAHAVQSVYPNRTFAQPPTLPTYVLKLYTWHGSPVTLNAEVAFRTVVLPLCRANLC